MQAASTGSRIKEKPPEKIVKSSQPKPKPYTSIKFNEINTRKSLNTPLKNLKSPLSSTDLSKVPDNEKARFNAEYLLQLAKAKLKTTDADNNDVISTKVNKTAGSNLSSSTTSLHTSNFNSNIQNEVNTNSNTTLLGATSIDNTNIEEESMSTADEDENSTPVPARFICIIQCDSYDI